MLVLNTTWSEGILNNIFSSTQNPLQCSFRILSIWHMNGNRLGRRAAALQRKLQESRGFQEIQMLQEIHQKDDVWPWCLKEILSLNQKPFCQPSEPPMCNWKPLAIPASIICSSGTFRYWAAFFFCTGICWVFQQYALTGRYEIQLFLFWLKNNSRKERSEFPRLCWDKRFHTITSLGDTRTIFVHVPHSVLIRIVAKFSF